MQGQGWLDRVAAIRQWTRNGERAPHKPLLLLFAIGRLQRTGSSRVAFTEAEPRLQALLDEFGPSGRRTSPAYPFHHLQTDGLWIVRTDDGSDPGSAVTKLRASHATGELDPEFEDALLAQPALAMLVARSILDTEFPESLHGDICTAAGLDIEAFEVAAALDNVARLPDTPTPGSSVS